MPQMAPMNWLILFFMFCTVFLLFNILNYFSFNYNYENLYKLNFKKSINNNSKNIFNWKW